MNEVKCKYCEKTFRKESTLAVHICEQKRRFLQQKEPAVQMGFQAYLKFFELTQGSSKLKTYNDFSDCPYYNAFVKFGRYIKNVNAIAPQQFIEWIIKQNKKLDRWCRDENYEEFLLYYTRHEQAEDALLRFLELTDKWAIDSGAQFNHIFTYANRNKLCFYITQGKISSWVIYNCQSGIAFLDTLNEEQLQVVFKWIDPEYWQKRFKDYFADSEYLKKTLKDSGF